MMESLFSSYERTRLTSRDIDEPKYHFLDTSAWPSVQRVREFWQGWFDLIPSGPKKVALAKGIQDRDDHKHLSHTAELFFFAALNRGGWGPELEPPGAKGA